LQLPLLQQLLVQVRLQHQHVGFLQRLPLLLPLALLLPGRGLLRLLVLPGRGLLALLLLLLPGRGLRLLLLLLLLLPGRGQRLRRLLLLLLSHALLHPLLLGCMRCLVSSWHCNSSGRLLRQRLGSLPGSLLLPLLPQLHLLSHHSCSLGRHGSRWLGGRGGGTSWLGGRGGGTRQLAWSR
jgi:hypothetical protein